jgi:integrase
MKLTKRTVEALVAPHPSGKQVLYWDAELKGFGVLVSGLTNSKTYIVQRRLPNGRTRRMTIEATNAIELDKAREEAEGKLHDIRTGNDPKALRRSLAKLTLRAALDDYLKARKDLTDDTRKDYRSDVERHLAKWLDLSLADVSPEMVEARHRDIKKDIEEREEDEGRGGAAANSVLRAFRAIYNFAADRSPNLPRNPVYRLRRQWFVVERRTRVVASDRLKDFYEAVDALPSRTHADYLKLLLFTGLRRTEAASLKWSDVDLPNRVIRIPAERTKAKRKLDLPMSDFVHTLIVARRALGKDGDYVFPSHSETGYLSEPKFPLTQVALTTGIVVSAHDLRRTFITVAESSDISPLALKALVNHALGGDVTAGYVILTTERLRDPAQKVAERMEMLCGIAPVATSKKVTRLR